MKSVKVNDQIINISSTPVLMFVTGERNLTIEKLVVDGKEYEIFINERGKAQMK